ncbi:MAG: hypothetical protein BJ554DRAFT_6701 [Olpidium bornovanus]|uniref:Uncharacterized protein n=1 Tax=Olpidium bornovanus TaxID=278681 RepID=A0A8H8A244_9FUNG|nr:MAG: hypothetical protein BJ554DRAFT_6701 [Olpidium bornovanus]
MRSPALPQPARSGFPSLPGGEKSGSRDSLGAPEWRAPTTPCVRLAKSAPSPLSWRVFVKSSSSSKGLPVKPPPSRPQLLAPPAQSADMLPYHLRLCRKPFPAGPLLRCRMTARACGSARVHPRGAVAASRGACGRPEASSALSPWRLHLRAYHSLHEKQASVMNDTVDKTSPDFKTNAAAMAELVDRLGRDVEKIKMGAPSQTLSWTSSVYTEKDVNPFGQRATQKK